MHSTPGRHRTSRYLILRQLGHGNLTRVYLTALRSALGLQLCVLKSMQHELSNDDDFRALFLDQSAAALSLRHPNLVRTFDVVSDAEACGLTMEFLEGQTLARLIERLGRNRFPVDTHLHILRAVLCALEHAHGQGGSSGAAPGNVHRDVCPSHVFITYDGQVKLLGMGFAESLRALELKLGRGLTDVRYAAPEVLLGEPAGVGADLFGLGVMIWEALARQSRVGSEDPAIISHRRRHAEEPDLEQAWPDAPLPLIALCRRALATNPRERYPNASALRLDLDAYLARGSESSAAVLGRLPSLMESLFGSEREQMQRFIDASLESASQHPASSLGAMLGPGDDLTPHDEEWNAPTSARIPAPRLSVPPGASNTAAGGAPMLPSPTASASTPVSTATLPSTAPPYDVARSGGASNEAPASTPGLQPPPSTRARAPRDSSTGGHRAYSSSLEGPSRRRPHRARFNPDLLGAGALILGSIVAAYSLHRYTIRERKPESEQLAIQAEARVPPAVRRASALGDREPSRSAQNERSPAAARSPAQRPPEPANVEAPTRSGAAAPARMDSAPDAGVPLSNPNARPAFFDGKVSASLVREAAPPLEADDLPTVDPELSSLQDAILAAARARRRTTGRKQEKKPPATPPITTSGATWPRPIDEADPYTDPSSE